MKRIVFFAFFIFIVTGCSATKIDVVPAGSNYQITLSVKADNAYYPRFAVVNEGSLAESTAIGAYMQEWMGLFQKTSPTPFLSKTNLVQLQVSNNLYKLFYHMGGRYFAAWPADVFTAGILQNIWLEWLKTVSGGLSRHFPDYAAGDKEVFRVPEIKKFLQEENLSPQITSELYPYEIQFLLTNVLFVSIQEFLTRPFRYFNISDIESVFYQVVVAPEAAEFTSYIIGRFGFDRFLQMAATNYSKEAWKAVFDEEVNETEGKFTRGMEERTFDAIQGAFKERLDSNLALYNKATKPSLFHK